MWKQRYRKATVIVYHDIRKSKAVLRNLALGENYLQNDCWNRDISLLFSRMYDLTLGGVLLISSPS